MEKIAISGKRADRRCAVRRANRLINHVSHSSGETKNRDSSTSVLARKTNKEDDCTGLFWEADYKSRALLDKKAFSQLHGLYRSESAVIAETPEHSDHTSIQLRIDYWKRKATGSESTDSNEDFQPS